MSDDKIREGIEELSKTKRISAEVAREAKRHPIEGEKIIRLVDIQEEQGRHATMLRKMELALFGDDDLEMKGLMHDVRTLKITVFRAGAMIGGGIAVGSLFLGLIGMWIEYTKH